jgi:hypothetical protein
MANFLQGQFKPHHPEKYQGKVDQIVYRSSWELSFMRRLDHDRRVVEWSSEEIKIPYTDPVTRRLKRYFPDFLVTMVEEGVRKTYLVEIKPDAQVKLPKKGKKKSDKQYMTEAFTYARNLAKWESAKRWCERHKVEWVILTEKNLPTWKGLSWKRML